MAASSRDRRRARAKKGLASDRARTLTESWPHYENELRARDLRPATVRQYNKVLVRLGRFVGDTPAAQVMPEMLEAWRDTLLHDEGVSATSVNNYLRQAGTFYVWLVSEGAIEESPTLAVDYVKQRDRGFACRPGDETERLTDVCDV